MTRDDAPGTNWLRPFIRSVPDFPSPGDTYIDMSALLADVDALRFTVETLADYFIGYEIDQVVGVGAQGFVFGASVACRLGAGFVPVRRGGDAPGPVIGADRESRGHVERLELSGSCLTAGTRAIIVDEVLASGQTIAVVAQMLDQLEAEIVGAAFVAELGARGGRERLGTMPVHTMLNYD